MIGDRLNIKPKHQKAAQAIFDRLSPQMGPRLTVAVAGQSGSGKSEIADALARLFDEAGHRTLVFQQDDYFFYPPRTNHNRRVDDIEWVGTKEVDLKLLDQHMRAFKDKPTVLLEKPLVIFAEDCITSEMVDLSPFDVVIAEGTYTCLLDNVDHRVFIDRDYRDTLEDRRERGRDIVDEFSEQVLKIEDRIISKHRTLADIVISKDFSVTFTDEGAAQ